MAPEKGFSMKGYIRKKKLENPILPTKIQIQNSINLNVKIYIQYILETRKFDLKS